MGKIYNGTFLMRTANGKLYKLDCEGAAEFDSYLRVPNLLADANSLQRLVYIGVIAGLTWGGYYESPGDWNPS
jgi:hypothetical protein